MSGMMSKLTNGAFLSVVVILCACSLASCGRGSSAQSLIADAKQFQDKGDWMSAQIQLKNAIQKSPDDVEARYLLGVVSNQGSDPQSGEKELRKALSLGMQPGKVWPELAKSMLMQGHYQPLLDETEALPKQSDILALRGNAYLGLGKNKEAKDAFESSLKNSPDLSSALIGLAKCALLDKDNEAATAYVEHAINKNPKDIDALLFKASMLRKQGALAPAQAVFDQILAINPNNVLAHLGKAEMEIPAQKYDAAKADIDAAQKAAPRNPSVWYMQVLLDFRQGKNTQALEGIQKVLHVAPNYMPGLLIAGSIEYNLGAMTQSEQYLSKYLEGNPGNLYASKLLASAMLKNKQASKARDVVTAALKDNPKDVSLLALAGEASMQNKDFTKATEYFEKASALAPQVAALHTALGLSKIGSGESNEAIAELETATSMDSKSPQAGVLLIMTHIRLKEYDKALAAADKLEVEEPKNPLIPNLKGVIFMAKNDVPNAQTSFQKALAIEPTYFPAVANLAQQDIRENKPDAAKKRFEALLVLDKKNIEAMDALASLALSQKHMEEATTWLERASNENPNSLPAAMRLTVHYMRIGEKQKALTLARKLQVSNPTNPDILELLAQTQFVNDQKPAALENYERLAGLLPDSAAVQLKIASIQMAMKNPSGAAEAVKKALSIQPDSLSAEIAQASLYMRDGNPAQALDIARQIQKQPGKAAIGYEFEGDILISQKKPELAANAYDHALVANTQNPRLVMKLHRSLIQAGKIKEADSRMAQWFKVHPEDTATRQYLADSYLTQKQNKAAIEQYQAVLHTQPQNVGALNNLAIAYQQEKDPHAEETAESAYKLAADNPQVQDTLGWILVESGNTNRGLPLLQKASTSAPDDMDIHFHLALGWIKAGDKVKARGELQQLVASQKPFLKMDEAKALLNKL